MEAEPSLSHLQTKAYVRQLQVIDNQNLLFEMSSKLEPKDMWRDQANLQAISTKPLVPDPINPHTHPFIPRWHRSTQLGCQSSQAPPPNHRTRTFVHENGVNCALSDSVSMLIMTTHSGLDSFLPFFFFLAVHDWRETCPDCTAISWTEPNRNKLNLYNLSSGPSETQTAFRPFMTLNYMRQSDLLNSDLWSSLLPCQHWHLLQPCAIGCSH